MHTNIQNKILQFPHTQLYHMQWSPNRSMMMAMKRERMENKNKVKKRRRKRLQVIIIHTIALAKQVLFFLRCSFVFGCSVAVIASYASYLILIASYVRLNWWRIQFSIRSWQRNISRSFRSPILFFSIVIRCMKCFCVWNFVSHFSQKINQNPFCTDRWGSVRKNKHNNRRFTLTV